MPRTGTTSPCTWSTRPGRRAELIARAGSGPATSAAALLAVALAKSAQVPLHFWLPRAMAAPTAVSAYLPSAAMVAAGVLPLGRGVIAVLASSVATETAAIITFALLAIAFVVLTSPVSGHAIARSARRRSARRR